MSAAATRDDLASVVTALTEQAATQRYWQAEFEAKAESSSGGTRELWLRFAREAKGTAFAFEVSADMISKYMHVDPEYTRVADGVTG